MSVVRRRADRQPSEPEPAVLLAAGSGFGRADRAGDLGGPEIRTFGDLASAWLKARRKRALLLPLPTLGKTAAGLKNAYNCTPDHAEGNVAWEQWLEKKYPAAQA